MAALDRVRLFFSPFSDAVANPESPAGDGLYLR